MSCHLFGKELQTRLITCNLLFFGMSVSIFPFDVGDRVWDLIQSVPEVFYKNP